MSKTNAEAVQADLAVAKNIYDHIGKRLHTLRCRWEDEREYEDFGEYRNQVSKWINEVQPIRGIIMDKRFKIQFSLGSIWVIIKMGLSRGTLQYIERVI
jgi:hypothetical protein